MSHTAKKLTGVVVGLALVIPLVLLAFIAPASRATPHHVPIGVAGPAQAVGQISGQLERRQPGAFTVTGYRTADELQAAARDREVYGGFVVGPTPQTVVATGASPLVAAMLTEIGGSLPDAGPVVDVAPATADDPRGAGFGSMVLPVFMTAMALGLTAATVGRRRRVMALMLPVGAAAVGATAVGVAMWAGVLGGAFWGQWLAMSSGILAIGAMVAGAVSVIGTAGAGMVAVVVMLVGMPLAGIASPPEFLPSFWATLGQSLPLGATGTALRSAAFFNPAGIVGAGAGTAYLVLAAWIAVGYGLMQLRREPADGRADERRLAGRSDAPEVGKSVGAADGVLTVR
ncbi:ABC transporter permease [Gordonia sp. (in: high G+C Gram-positive bacteria)]|uniref:ABC transporter permease n=1 Tax=Gordonia sp. (in: high G+C Gram-positive bacteria) TaxID=84139 RepID=UPI003C7844F4